MFAVNAVNYDPYDMDIVKNLFNDVKCKLLLTFQKLTTLTF